MNWDHPHLTFTLKQARRLFGMNRKEYPGVTFGQHCVVEHGVKIGPGTVVKNFVELRKGTVIGENCYIDSRVSSSGECTIGDNVTLRYGVIVARGCEIGDDCYICPRVMFNNLDAGQNSIGGAKIGKGCFVGTHSVIHHGITIGEGTTVGACSFVSKDIDGGTWVGIPARRL